MRVWVIEDFRDAPMEPIAMFRDENLARAFAAEACGEHAFVYVATAPGRAVPAADLDGVADSEAEDVAPVVSGPLAQMLEDLRTRQRRVA
jgi:hypothetical protein